MALTAAVIRPPKTAEQADKLLWWYRRAERIREQIAETNLALVLAMAKRTRSDFRKLTGAAMGASALGTRGLTALEPGTVLAMDVDGDRLERITTYDGFDAVPMFSRDGRYLAFSSNRGGSQPGETNVFIAEWR